MFSRSSIESEYKALALVTTKLLWLKYVLYARRLPLPHKPIVYCDNISTQHLAKNPIMHSQTKNIKVDFHFVCDQVNKDLLDVHYVTSINQIADVFTKAIPTPRFVELKHKLLVLPSPEFKGDC